MLASLLLARLILEPLIRGLDSPVQVVSAHDDTGDLYIALQDGRVLQFDGTETRLFLDLRPIVSCCSNGGLLSVVFHPDYARNRTLFVQYVDLDGDTAIARYRGTSREMLLVIPQPKDNIPNHHGGTLAFGPDGFLYISVGDGGAYSSVTNRAQELHHLLGKLLRIDVDRGSPYAIPPDNPYVGLPGARGEIWSIGLRNPWRYSFDRITGEVMIGDVGQDLWEEIDILSIEAARGANFGWPITEGRHCFPPGSSCETRNLTLPAFEYSRSLGCSVTGGYRYRGSRWPSLQGKYLYGDWCSGRIWADGVEVADTDNVIVSFGEDDAGELYVVDYRGTILRVSAPEPRRRAVGR